MSWGWDQSLCSFLAAYERDLEADITGDTSGHFRKMLVVLLQVGLPWGPPRALPQGAEGSERLVPVPLDSVARERLLGGSSGVKSSSCFLATSPPLPILSSNLRWSLWLA